MLDIKPSKEMKLETLKVRKKVCLEDDFELVKKIEDAAAHGEFELCFVHNKMEDYPTISAETIKRLKKAGYKVNLWYKKNGWDDLHRYYKGALKVTWYK